MAEEQIVNFDEKSESLHYKCPSCGAALTFDPEKQALVCEHCGTEQKIEFDSDVKERSFEELFSAEGWKGDVKVIQCQNCGAREVLQKNQISATCPFCGSASVVEKDEMPGVKPDTVIPFKIDEEVAKKSCIKWLKGRFFSPSFVRTPQVHTKQAPTPQPMRFSKDTNTGMSAKAGSFAKSL